MKKKHFFLVTSAILIILCNLWQKCVFDTLTHLSGPGCSKLSEGHPGLGKI